MDEVDPSTQRAGRVGIAADQQIVARQAGAAAEPARAVAIIAAIDTVGGAEAGALSLNVSVPDDRTILHSDRY
ncbi:hypothetical protein AC629_32285 [Bradyrhizobium sp. NAS80.1]|nr:hypothetical protein AC629_32285 [Bradyrhizobium sp. NAS80.1]